MRSTSVPQLYAMKESVCLGLKLLQHVLRRSTRTPTSYERGSRRMLHFNQPITSQMKQNRQTALVGS